MSSIIFCCTFASCRAIFSSPSICDIFFYLEAGTESKKAKVPMSDAMKTKARLALSGGRDIDRYQI